MQTKAPELLPVLTQVVRELRAQGRHDILTVEALLDKFVGDSGAGKMLRRLLYWLPRAKNREGWVYKSWRDWDAECAISEGMLKRVHAKKRLEAVGVERVVKKANGTPTNHYRLDISAFIRKLSAFLSVPVELLRSWLKVERVESAETETPECPMNEVESADSIRHKPPNEKSPILQMDLAQTAEPITTESASLKTSSLLTIENNNNIFDDDDDFPENKAEEKYPADLPAFPDIAPAVMLKLVEAHGRDRARAVIAYAKTQDCLTNPAGFVVARIRDNKLGFEHPDDIERMNSRAEAQRYTGSMYSDFVRY